MKNTSKKPEMRVAGYYDDWKWHGLDEQMYIKSRIGWQALTKKEYMTYGDYYLITGTDIDEETHTVDLTRCFYVSKERYEMDDKIQIHEGDIIVTKDGTIGKVAMVKGLDKPATLNSHLFVLRDMSGELDNRFLLRLFTSHIFESFVESTKTGSTLTGLPQKTFTKFKFLVPELEEQKKIASYFDNLDLYMSFHQKEIERLICVRKAMMEKMFPQNGADVPAVRFGRYKEPWRLCQFSEIFTERHIIDTISDEYPQLAFTIEEGVIRPEDKKTNKRDFLIIDKATKKYLQTEYDDIIYNPANVIYGAIHRNALGKGCVSPIYKIFYTDQDSTFMECIVRHPNFIKEISRSMEGTVKKLRTLKPKAFLEMSAYIAPTIEEQKQIGEYFRQMDRLIEIEKEELEKIKHIKSACLEKMFV